MLLRNGQGAIICSHTLLISHLWATKSTESLQLNSTELNSTKKIQFTELRLDRKPPWCQGVPFIQCLSPPPLTPWGVREVSKKVIKNWQKSVAASWMKSGSKFWPPEGTKILHCPIAYRPYLIIFQAFLDLPCHFLCSGLQNWSGVACRAIQKSCPLVVKTCCHFYSSWQQQIFADFW